MAPKRIAHSFRAFPASVAGYDDLHAIHTCLHRQPVTGSASRYETVQIVSPTPDIVVAQVRRVALDADGQPLEPSADLGASFSEMALYVLVRQNGHWRLAAGQNTPIRPTLGASFTPAASTHDASR